MPTQKTILVYEPGETIIIHGKTMTVIRSETLPLKRKGEFTGEEQTRVLAEDEYGQLCWFPVSKIEQEEAKSKKKK